MDHRLNKLLWLFIALIFGISVGFSQVDATETLEYKDYKDKEQFEKFYKRRKWIAAWQIQQLKQGALIVRLKTNELAINELRKKGLNEAADKKQRETYALNINIMQAYLKFYTFSKLYFIYSNSYEDLLKGVRKGIFISENLMVDSTIKMPENFYLLAESDRVYNSSIGFVKEDSAKFVSEAGSPSPGRELPAVIKNKYGHQLKGPFPYAPAIKLDMPRSESYIDLKIYGEPMKFRLGTTQALVLNEVWMNFKGQDYTIKMAKHYSYWAISSAIEHLNYKLFELYHDSKKFDESKIPSDVRPFLY
jgi:hypothetical protein